MALLRTHTLGCKVNQYETELVRQALTDIGYRDALGDESADLCVVNTCTVTHEGDAKSRQVIRQLAKRNPQTRILVMGCYATRAPEEVAALPGVVEVVQDKRELPDVLGRFGVRDMPEMIRGMSGRQRAWVKVQDGCLLRCSFCIIPSVRPHLASRDPEQVVAEVRGLVEAGYHEMVLTGIHLGHYGVERNHQRPKDQWLRLHRLLERLVQLPGDFRLRLSSIEATEVTRELLATMAGSAEKICPHLHVSMQSGSDAVLRRMRRRWCSRRFVDRCALAQQMLHLPALSTDVIVGFPGETEANFRETLDVCREVGFTKIHIFPFSPRRGTPAATMPDQVAPEVRAERVARLAQLEVELREQYHARLIGHRLQVLVESPHPVREGWMIGSSCRQASVELPGHVGERRMLRKVVVSHSTGERLVAIDAVAADAVATDGIEQA